MCHKLCTNYLTSASWRYVVILYILSAEDKQTHSLLLWNMFFFFFLKILNSGFHSGDSQGPPDTTWSSGHLQESLYDVGRRAHLSPDLHIKTDRGPVKLMLCRKAALPAREVGYKYPPHTAVSSVSSKSKHFRFYLVIYHCSLSCGGKIKGREMWSWKIVVCTVVFIFYIHCVKKNSLKSTNFFAEWGLTKL